MKNDKVIIKEEKLLRFSAHALLFIGIIGFFGLFIFSTKAEFSALMLIYAFGSLFLSLAFYSVFMIIAKISENLENK